MSAKTNQTNNLLECALLVEEIKMALYEYDLTDEEANRILENYNFHMYNNRFCIELCDYCAVIDEQYQFLISKGYKNESARKGIISNSRFLIRNSIIKEKILEYLGPEVEEAVYLQCPNNLMLSPEVLYARFAFLLDYNKKAILEDRKTYSMYAVSSINRIETNFNECNESLVKAFPIPIDIKLAVRYPDNPQKRQFIKSMLIAKANREAKNNT